MTHPILRQLRHDVWATGKLIERCRQLTAEQLQHEGYLIRLFGVLLHEPLGRPTSRCGPYAVELGASRRVG